MVRQERRRDVSSLGAYPRWSGSQTSGSVWIRRVTGFEGYAVKGSISEKSSKRVQGGEPIYFRLILFLPLVCRTPPSVRPFASLFSPSSAHTWPHPPGARHSPFRD